MYKLTPLDYDFMKKARFVATKSDCIRSGSRFGAIAVRDGEVIASGWNGYVGNMAPCGATGKCIRQELKIESGTRREVAHCICAEQRLICNAAREGTSLDGAVMYVTGLPCEVCVRLIIACGISKVIYESKYLNEQSYKQAELGGLKLIQIATDAT